MKTNIFKLFALIFIFTGIKSYAQTAQEILLKYDQVTYAPKDQKSEITIVLTDKSGVQTTRKAIMLQKGKNMRLTKFTYPESQAGIGFLSLPNDVMYVYLPAFEKERRIASHVKNQTFAGTDFSYDDMESVPFSNKYNPKLVSTTTDAFVLELTPKNPALSEYSKIILTIDKVNYYGKKTEYYNKSGIKFKELVSTCQKKGNYWVATTAEMTNLLTGHKTKMIITNVVFDSNLADTEFTIKKLSE